MRSSRLVLALAVTLASPLAAAAGGHGSGGHSYRSHATGSHSSSHRSHAGGSTTRQHSTSGTHDRSHASWGAPSGHGKTKRDPRQREAFMRTHPCPSTGRTHGACPGYVVDHVRPLKRGGADSPSNMQWQSVEAAKAKDRWE